MAMDIGTLAPGLNGRALGLGIETLTVVSFFGVLTLSLVDSVVLAKHHSSSTSFAYSIDTFGFFMPDTSLVLPCQDLYLIFAATPTWTYSITIVSSSQ
jgi:hypothetical protein